MTSDTHIWAGRTGSCLVFHTLVQHWRGRRGKLFGNTDITKEAFWDSKSTARAVFTLLLLSHSLSSGTSPVKASVSSIFSSQLPLSLSSDRLRSCISAWADCRRWVMCYAQVLQWRITAHLFTARDHELFRVEDAMKRTITALNEISPLSRTQRAKLLQWRNGFSYILITSAHLIL